LLKPCKSLISISETSIDSGDEHGRGILSVFKTENGWPGGPVIVPGAATTAFRLLVAKKKVVGERGRDIDMPGDIFDQPGRPKADLTAQVKHKPCRRRSSLWWSKYGVMSVWHLVCQKEARFLTGKHRHL
jgi:hypothetical protein